MKDKITSRWPSSWQSLWRRVYRRRGAGPVTSIGSSGQSGPTQAVELDQTARSIVEVELAIKNFEQRDFDQCIQRLAKARSTHPELPPPGALFAKLAFLGNEGALIRPALERAVVEDGKHPEVFILFGNLAQAEGRLTDAAVHFEKAMSLARRRAGASNSGIASVCSATKAMHW